MRMSEIPAYKLSAKVGLDIKAYWISAVLLNIAKSLIKDGQITTPVVHLELISGKNKVIKQQQGK